jgi:hypothetical protein
MPPPDHHRRTDFLHNRQEREGGRSQQVQRLRRRMAGHGRSDDGCSATPESAGDPVDQHQVTHAE